MPVGTSLGQWFPDRFSHATQKYSTRDNNVVTPEDMRTNKELDKAEQTELGTPVAFHMDSLQEKAPPSHGFKQDYDNNSINTEVPDSGSFSNNHDRFTRDKNEYGTGYPRYNLEHPKDLEVSLKDMPFPDNKNPDTDFSSRYQGFSSTGNLTDEDLQRAGLRFRGVDDRTNETMLDQLSANASALKVWGHNLIHPDPAEPLPPKTKMAEDLGIDDIKADPPDRMRDLKLMYDNVISDALATGRIFKGMYESLGKGDWRDSKDLSPDN